MITIQEILNNPVRSLSWKEPYGSLMLHGKVETRTRDTKYRGLVLICTSAQSYPIDKIQEISGHRNFYRILDMASHNDLLLKSGHAIAIGRLIDCKYMKPGDDTRCYVSFDPRLFCYTFKDVTPIKPFPWKGSQGWSIVTDEQKQLIELI